MKNEKPNMNFVLKLFKLQNWRKPSPAEAAFNLQQNESKYTMSFKIWKYFWSSKLISILRTIQV